MARAGRAKPRAGSPDELDLGLTLNTSIKEASDRVSRKRFILCGYIRKRLREATDLCSHLHGPGMKV